MKHIFPIFHGAQVIVIGDLMLDSFYFGKASRISPEAPVPVVNIDHIEELPGGAANVAMNLASLGISASVSGITGNDQAAITLQQRLNSVGVTCVFHYSDNKETKSTERKKRVR